MLFAVITWKIYFLAAFLHEQVLRLIDKTSETSEPTCMVVSIELENRNRPDGDTCRCVTVPMCPERVNVCCWVFTSNTWIFWLYVPEKTAFSAYRMMLGLVRHAWDTVDLSPGPPYPRALPIPGPSLSPGP